MRLRRVIAVYALTLAMCLLVLGNESRPDTAAGGRARFDAEMTLAGPVLRPDGTPALGSPRLTGNTSNPGMTPKGPLTAVPAQLGQYDIPATALLAYQRAADILAEVKPSCGLRWTLLAAIGRVESDHGQYGGSVLGTNGVVSPAVVGVSLNGNGQVATIPDTDGGRLDGDPRWDHAVGPMQFIPSTWAVVGVDGDGDGKRNINDIYDAALAAGVYLCAGAENLKAPGAVDAALHRYNDSDAYAALVMAYEQLYAGGGFAVTAPDGALAAASASLLSHPLAGTPMKAATRAQARLQARVKAAAKHAAAAADRTGGRTPGISAVTTTTTVVAAAVTTPSEVRGAQAAAAASGAGRPTASGVVTTTTPGTATPGGATSTPTGPAAPPPSTAGAGASTPSSPPPTTSTGGSTSSPTPTQTGSTGGSTATSDPTPTQPAPSAPAPSTSGTGATTPTSSSDPSATPTTCPTPTSPATPGPTTPDPTAGTTCVPPATTDPTASATP